VRDCVAGQEAVKKRTTKYLPRLSEQADSAYDGYLQRAQFMAFTARTRNVSLGQMFRKPPLVAGVDEAVLDNIDLAGSPFNTFSRVIADELLQTNRAGVWLDYSNDMVRPYLTFFPAETIINWQTKNIGGQVVLSRVVLEGKISDPAADDY